MTIFSRHLAIISTFIMVLAISPSAFAGGGDDWRPVTTEELAMKTPKVEAGADAEAIFWEVRVDDSGPDLAKNNYVRVKIFTERGREMFSKYDIQFYKGVSIKDLEARVIKPDGSIVMLKKEDIFEQEVVKADGFKIKAKSFAMPGLEVGAILEYRYREVNDYGFLSLPLILQRDIPVQVITYYIKPFRGRMGMYAQPFNTGDTWFEDDKNGFKRLRMNNVPAFRREPDMLPENEVRSWVYLYYSFAPDLKDRDEYWKNTNKAFFEYTKDKLKPTDEIKQKTAEVITGAASDDEKLKKIYEFVQGKIRNPGYETNVKQEDWKKIDGEKSPADTLKMGMGNSTQIEYLFGAMARAAGLDARAAYTSDRSELLCSREIPNARLVLTRLFMAVRSGGDWRFFSPSSIDVPYGMINWVLEGQMAMISDPKEPIWTDVKLALAESSVAKRTGKFKLLPDGTLEGEARVEFTGHWAVYHKALNRGDSAAEQEKRLRAYVRNTILSSAEVQSFNIENTDTGNKAFAYSFKITIPQYAAKTGKRLFFQPGVFERNAKPRFISSTRKSDIYFTYPWMETDEFTIELPDGFGFESAEAPGLVTDRSGIGRDEVGLVISQDGKTLSYHRKFSFGNGGAIRFGPESYPILKDMFESYNRVDTHLLTLREASTPVKAN